MNEEVIEIHIREGDDYIKLGQALKLAGLVGSGVEAKMIIQDGIVSVNDQIDTRRGRKLYPGDVVSFENNEIRVL
ncbi:MAG: RNA-binding S4 domain-containing protein [Lachnospiraceae bacterium]|nr:RNA-binding S4 domain-containing protein [Lachnospiraceae bacterium]